MSNYRISDGSEKTKAEVIALNPNVSLPKVWDADVLATLNIDVIFETPKPTPSGTYKMVVRDGIEQDAKDNWVEKWVEQDMFADNDDKTKAEQETEYQAILDADAAKSVRSRRDGLLVDTDFYALSDVTMADDMKTYRQALRDITGHSNFPSDLTDSDWPTKP
jgi:hypothetical protein